MHVGDRHDPIRVVCHRKACRALVPEATRLYYVTCTVGTCVVCRKPTVPDKTLCFAGPLTTEAAATTIINEILTAVLFGLGRLVRSYQRGVINKTPADMARVVGAGFELGVSAAHHASRARADRALARAEERGHAYLANRRKKRAHG